MRTLLFLGMLCLTFSAQAQSYAFGIKGGATTGFQRWDNSFSSRDPLYRYHGIVFIETAEEDSPFALFAQAGYHIKGSAIRTFPTKVTTPTGFRDVPGFTIPFEFHNLSLTLGAKQQVGYSPNLYYMLGIRGDYTLSTNLDETATSNNSIYLGILPFDDFVTKFNYGITLGGGIQFDFSEYVATFIELTVNPDFSKQYRQPAIPNVRNPNPNNSNSLITIPERQISNTTIELTLGFRFLHKIVYYN